LGRKGFFLGFGKPRSQKKGAGGRPANFPPRIPKRFFGLPPPGPREFFVFLVNFWNPPHRYIGKVDLPQNQNSYNQAAHGGPAPKNPGPEKTGDWPRPRPPGFPPTPGSREACLLFFGFGMVFGGFPPEGSPRTKFFPFGNRPFGRSFPKGIRPRERIDLWTQAFKALFLFRQWPNPLPGSPFHPSIPEGREKVWPPPRNPQKSPFFSGF